MRGRKIIKPDDAEYIRMVMDHRAMHRKLAAVLFPGDEDKLKIRIHRAFPWSLPGKGVIEYEIIMREGLGHKTETKIINAHHNNAKKGPMKTLRAGSSPLTDSERELFLTGKKALALTDPPVILSTYPLDSRMSWLPDLMDTKSIGQLLERHLSDFLNGRSVSAVSGPALLGYRFGKRCTLKYDVRILGAEGEGPAEIQLIGKTYRDSRGRSTFNNLQQLWNWSLSVAGTRPPVIPRPFCYVPEYRMCLRESKKGFDLSELKVREVRHELLSRVSEILSTFHASEVSVAGHFTLEDEISLLDRMSAYLPVVRPELEVMSRKMLDLIRRKAGSLRIKNYTPRITHRDFHDKQIIVGVNEMYLTDFDTVAMSDQTIDVGNFLAHIFLRSLQVGESREEMLRDSYIFLSAYILHNPPADMEKIAFYRMTSLYRLACLYAYRPSWKGLVVKLLEECWNQAEHSGDYILDLHSRSEV